MERECTASENGAGMGLGGGCFKRIELRLTEEYEDLICFRIVTYLSSIFFFLVLLLYTEQMSRRQL